MKQIFNWTIGSFFRTIGRTIALLVLGSLLYYIISSNGIRLTDLFIMKVNASVITEDVKYIGTTYITETQTGWTNTDGMFVKNVSTNNNEQVSTLSFNSLDTTDADYIQFSFSVSQPTNRVNDSTPTSEQQDHYCNKWTCNQYCASGACAGMCEVYQCSSYSSRDMGSEEQYFVTDQDFTALNLIITANYAGGWSTCQIIGNSISCPTLKRRITSIDFHINFKDTMNTYNSQLMVHRSITKYVYANQEIINSINNQTQQQQQQHNEMMNDTTTDAEDEAADFFSDFDVPDVGGLSAIITAPLNTIQSLLSNSCSNLVLPLPFVNENLTLPCLGSIYNQHFGAFFTLYQTIILAIVSYRCIRSIYFDIHGFTNPNDDRIEVMDL